MNAKSLKLLRIGALVLGWLLVVGVLAGIWGRFVIYYQYEDHFLGSVAQFSIVSAFDSFFSTLGNALFAFLIAAVFRMIEKQAPVGNENAKRLMIVCCLSFVADALVRFYSSILTLTTGPRWAGGFDWLLPYSSIAIPVLVPILYAASIFVLYTHFTKMVMFESEVA
jgi:hypothetical protein